MFPVKKITVLCRGRGAAKFVKAISMCHNVYLTESRDGGKALQLWRSPRVLRGMGSIDLVAVFPWNKKRKQAVLSGNRWGRWREGTQGSS